MATPSCGKILGHSEFEASGIRIETLSVGREGCGSAAVRSCASAKVGASLLASRLKIIGSCVNFGVVEIAEVVAA